MIYIIGDSHVSVFSGTDTTHDGLRHIQPEFGECYTIKKGKLRDKINRFEQKILYFCPIKIGSHTAYNSYSKLYKIEMAIEEYNIKEKEYIFLCFGEIDIRNHIGPKAQKENISLEKGIEVCVEEYMRTVTYLKSKYKNINIGVYGPPASSTGYWNNSTVYGFADVVTRNKMTLYFNKYLKKRCDEYNIIFKEIASKMILDNGTTNQKFIMDDIHLSQKTMPLIKEEFSDIIKKCGFIL